MIFKSKKRAISAQKLSLSIAVACSLAFASSTALAKPSADAPSLSSTNVLLPGTRFSTPWYVQDSGIPGPTIFIVGGVHGNEPAGANAAEMIRRWPLLKGKMVVIPRANVPGLSANKRLIPNLDTNLGNLNRNYPRAGRDEGPRGEPATSIWNLALKFKPDWVLDLHEGFDFHQVNENSVGSSVICFPNPKARATADAMLAAVNSEISVENLKFVRRDMPIDGSLARAGGEHLHVPSMTLETTSRQPMEKRVHQHEVLVHTVLQQLGMIGDAIPGRIVATAAVPKSTGLRAPAGAKIRIALYKGPGTGGDGPKNLMKRFDRAPETTITEVSPDDIRSGVLTNYSVVIFAGGSGSKEAEAIGETGRSNVVNFVANGGGYVGICAGAYLATSGYPWSLHILNVRTVSSKWQRGRGAVKLEITDGGQKILEAGDKNTECLYHNGPIVKEANEPSLPPYEPLAYFRSEFASNGSPAGVMVNSPALIAASYKKGRVIFCSPHPEQTKGLEEIIPHAVTWSSSSGDIEKPAVSREAAGQ
jgi:predicted deacylase